MTANAVDELRALLITAADDLAAAIPASLNGYGALPTRRIVAEAQAIAMLRFAALSLLPPAPPPVETSRSPHASARTRDAHGRFASHHSPPPPPPE